jgi:hypothetical protein
MLNAKISNNMPLSSKKAHELNHRLNNIAREVLVVTFYLVPAGFAISGTFLT